MRLALAHNWWMLVLRGVLAILVGIATFFWPGITLIALVFLFAGYAFINGVMSLAGAIRAVAAHDRWGVLMVEGIVGILAAAITALWPAIILLSLVFVIAAWSIITGVAEIVAAVRLRKYISGEWLLAVSGIASVILGVLVVALPIAGALAIAFWFGAYELVFGSMLLALGFRLRSWDREQQFGGARIPAPAH